MRIQLFVTKQLFWTKWIHRKYNCNHNQIKVKCPGDKEKEAYCGIAHLKKKKKKKDEAKISHNSLYFSKLRIFSLSFFTEWCSTAKLTRKLIGHYLHNDLITKPTTVFVRFVIFICLYTEPAPSFKSNWDKSRVPWQSDYNPATAEQIHHFEHNVSKQFKIIL